MADVRRHQPLNCPLRPMYHRLVIAAHRSVQCAVQLVYKRVYPTATTRTIQYWNST